VPERKRKKSLSEHAYGKLRDLIITLDLKPGARINEGVLERDLAIGRTPVREALLRLVNQGFLTSIPGRGFFVREVTLDGVKALFEAVMILQRGCIALAARRITDDELSRLQDIHRELKRAMADQHYLQVTLLNSRFHRVIHEASRNDFLIASMHNLEPQYDRLAYFCFSEQAVGDGLKEHFGKVTVDHGRLIDHLKRRDEQSAVDAVTDHIRLFHSRVTRYLLPPMQAIEAANGRSGRRL
jgi:DNA-binding GntR family transcriptional regulator